MPGIRVLQTRSFARSFSDCLARNPLKIQIVAPFMDKPLAFPSVSSFSSFVLGRGVKYLEITTIPPDSKGGSLRKDEADLLEKLGVALKIRTNPFLHSKIYYFEFDNPSFFAFIGSANFSLGGFSSNDETMVEITSTEDQVPVRKELERLTGLGALPYHAWKSNSKKGLIENA